MKTGFTSLADYLKKYAVGVTSIAIFAVAAAEACDISIDEEAMAVAYGRALLG